MHDPVTERADVPCRRLKCGRKGKGFKADAARRLGYVVEQRPGDAAMSELGWADAWPFPEVIRPRREVQFDC